MAQVIKSTPGIGAAFGTGLGSGLNKLADAKLKQMIEAPQREAYASALMSILAPQQEQQQSHVEPQLQGQQAQVPQQMQQPQVQQDPLIAALKKGGLSKEDFFQLAGLQQQKQLNQEKKAGQIRKEERDIQKEINASTQKYYDDIIARGKSAGNNIKRANRLEELSLKGNLPPAELYKFVSRIEEGAPNPIYGASAGAFSGGQVGALIGGPIGAGIGAAVGGIAGASIGPLAGTVKSVLARRYTDTEEFEKLSADFIKDAKGIFGGRITDDDLKAFFQTIPTLNQTTQGRLKIIKNLKAFNEAAIAESQALEEVIEENGGKRPYNLQFLVNKKVQDKLDKASQEFSA